MTKKQVLSALKGQKHPLGVKRIAEITGENKKEIRAILDELLSNGQVSQHKGLYTHVKQSQLIEGEFRTTNSEAAFLIPEKGGDDSYVPNERRMGAMNGDKVLARRVYQSRNGRRNEVEVVKIVSRARESLVGRYYPLKSGGYVQPEERFQKELIYVPDGREANAFEGALVVVHIDQYPDGVQEARGEIIEVLGHKGDHLADLTAIIRRYGLRDTFPKEVLDQAADVPLEVPHFALANRLDLRDEMIVTMDGADAKDLDDAISLTKTQDGYELDVHIADVSYYVGQGTPIDREAWQRGTSVYMLDTVIPMLPEKLSNGICSLTEGMDRMALSCLMKLDIHGNLVSTKMAQSVIHSAARLTYEEVNKALATGQPEGKLTRPGLFDMVMMMNRLKNQLRRNRMHKGMVDLDVDEPFVKLAEDGTPVEIGKRVRGEAQMLVEQFMLSANEAVAMWLREHGSPLVYRIHDVPDDQKMADFAILLKNLGIDNRGIGANTKPIAFQKVLEHSAGTPYENIIKQIGLRSMRKAIYSTENHGHFGLAMEEYCHFTSPIRRYPDLTVHRMVKRVLEKEEMDRELLTSQLEAAAVQSTNAERSAMDAERDAVQMKMAQYMSGYIGEEFDGIVSGVTEHGYFVELENMCEGFVSITLLKDTYSYDEKRYTLSAVHGKHTISLGDQTRIIVASVDQERYNIQFAPADAMD